MYIANDEYTILEKGLTNSDTLPELLQHFDGLITILLHGFLTSTLPTHLAQLRYLRRPSLHCGARLQTEA